MYVCMYVCCVYSIKSRYYLDESINIFQVKPLLNILIVTTVDQVAFLISRGLLQNRSYSAQPIRAKRGGLFRYERITTLLLEGGVRRPRNAGPVRSVCAQWWCVKWPGTCVCWLDMPAMAAPRPHHSLLGPTSGLTLRSRGGGIGRSQASHVEGLEFESRPNQSDGLILI